MELKPKIIQITTDMEKTVLRLTPDEGRIVVWNDHDDFETVETNIVGVTRRSIIYENIYKQKPSGKFFETSYSVGATESQDERPYEYDGEAVFEEVFPIEKLVTVYE
jgi:hypothetical protein